MGIELLYKIIKEVRELLKGVYRGKCSREELNTIIKRIHNLTDI
jgi:hypothetical protein